MMRPALLFVASFAAALAAASPVGIWTGKFQVKLPAMPANATPAQKEAMAKGMAALKTAKIVLTLKADKTYSTKMVGLPMAVPSNDGGTWSQMGDAVTLKPKSKPGSGPARKLDLSKDGKTMTVLLPNGQGKIVFTR